MSSFVQISCLLFVSVIKLASSHGDHGDAVAIFNWSTIDYNWPSRYLREKALRDGNYVPLNNVPNGIRVYDNRIFVTVPRPGKGVPSTLNTLINAHKSKRYLSSRTVLKPYPNWDMQTQGNCTAFQKVQNIEIDPKRGIMYVIDTGGRMFNCPAKIVIYDIKNDVELRRHIFPDDVVSRGTNYLNDLVMDYVNGNVEYLYITNTRDFTLVVYDIKNDNSYAFADDSMLPEPGKTSVKVLNDVVKLTNGVNGIAISANFKYVYYSPIAGTGLYQIPTQILRNSSANFTAHVRKVGDKPSQGGGMIMSTMNSLYFSVLSENAIAMWEIHRDAEKYGGEDRVKMETLTYEAMHPMMEWVDALALDSSGYLWFTTSRLERFSQIKNDSINFRIWRAFVHEPSYAYFKVGEGSEYGAPSSATKLTNLCSSFVISLVMCFRTIGFIYSVF